jgi:hypothetical protein
MAYNDNDNDNDEIECKIIESYGIFSGGIKFWNKEINLVSWNGRPAKLDIRNWQRDHERCGKGIALTREEAEELVKLLSEILRKKPRPAKPGVKPGIKPGRKSGAKKKKPPESLEPFYDELELIFGAGPDECKSARNTLLKKFHPDKNTSNTAFATRKTIKIKEAYERIMAWWKEQKS